MEICVYIWSWDFEIVQLTVTFQVSLANAGDPLGEIIKPSASQVGYYELIRIARWFAENSALANNYMALGIQAHKISDIGDRTQYEVFAH